MFEPPDSKKFYRMVWKIVREIPVGSVSTYGQIASMIPAPEGVEPQHYDRMRARWVGSAMRRTPAGSGVPWHRVINSQGKISLPRGGPGADEQRFLLEMEEVVFDKNGRVDLKKYGWDGPSKLWLDERKLYSPKQFRKSDEQEEDAGASQLNLL